MHGFQLKAQWPSSPSLASASLQQCFLPALWVWEPPLSPDSPGAAVSELWFFQLSALYSQYSSLTMVVSLYRCCLLRVGSRRHSSCFPCLLYMYEVGTKHHCPTRSCPSQKWSALYGSSICPQSLPLALGPMQSSKLPSACFMTQWCGQPSSLHRPLTRRRTSVGIH